MTAPPLFNFSEAAHLANVASFLSPASTASDSGFSWTSMASGQGSNRPPSQPRNMSPPSNGNNASSSGNDLLFITGNTPADFKTKKNMTKVRKKAMGSYLEKEKKPRDPTKDQQQRKREGSAGSRTSAGSEPHDVMPNSEAMRIFKGEKKKARKQTESTARSTHEPNRLLPEMQMISATPRLSVDFVLPSAPIVLPMRTGVALPYDGFSPRPFLSIGKPLDPFRAMFQASHPKVSVEELKWYCSRSFGTRAMGMHWIPTLVKSPHAFLSTLCIASAHYDAINERPVESVQTLALRQEVVHLIGQNLVNPSSSVDDYNVIALTQLIASELISGERTALNFHEKGVEAMVQKRGGVNQLGVNGRLASTLSWVSLESAILHEEKPRSVYSDFCASSSTKNYPNTATIPESPLFCPRAEFETLRRSSRCTPRAMDLLKDIRMMMDIFLHETKQSRQNLLSLKNIYKKITTQYPSAAGLQKTNVFTPNDWKYEVIRVTSIITATAIMKRIPFSSALKFSAEVETPNLTPLYTSSNASGSNESLTLPNDHRHDSAVTTMSTNSFFEASPAFEQPNPFAFTPNHQTRPSFSSTHSSEPIFFPAPQAPAPSGPAALLTNLKIAIENSDLSDCWGDMAGVLLWVALIVGAASRESNKVMKKWYAALAVRVSIVLCFEHPEAIHSSLLRMGEVVECVGYAGSNTEVAKREPSASGSAGKRRRV